MNKFYKRFDWRDEDKDKANIPKIDEKVTKKELIKVWNNPVDSDFIKNIVSEYPNPQDGLTPELVANKIADFKLDEEWLNEFYDKFEKNDTKVVMRRVPISFVGTLYFDYLKKIIKTIVSTSVDDCCYELIVNTSTTNFIEVSIQRLCMDLEICKIFMTDDAGDKHYFDIDAYIYAEKYIKELTFDDRSLSYSVNDSKQKTIIALNESIEKRIRKSINKGKYSCTIWSKNKNMAVSEKILLNFLKRGFSLIAITLNEVYGKWLLQVELIWNTDDNIKSGKVYSVNRVENYDKCEEISLKELIKMLPAISVIERISEE